jgi:catechol 1,2-dioxygenase
MDKNNIGNALTEKAITAYSRIEDTRLRELVTSLIRHLHVFVKETKLTDEEFEYAWTLMAEMAKFTGDQRNEFLLFCDVIGVSQLVEAISHVRPQSAVGLPLSAPSTGLTHPCGSGATRLPVAIQRENGSALAVESTI